MSHVHVALRMRPPKADNSEYVTIVPPGMIVLTKPGDGEMFHFQYNNAMLGVDNQTVYDSVARQVVDAFLDGYNGTLLAYGQTGAGMVGSVHLRAQCCVTSLRILLSKHNAIAVFAIDCLLCVRALSTQVPGVQSVFCFAGKTFTMLGPGTKLKDMTEDEQGCMPRAMAQVFEALETSGNYTSWKMQLSYIEVYLDKIYDLLRTPGTPATVEGDVTVMKDGVARLKNITPTPVESLKVGVSQL
jgi:hypothetical protein